MSSRTSPIRFAGLCLLLMGCFLAARSHAQQDKAKDNTVTIRIIGADVSSGTMTDSGEVRRFRGDVAFEQNGTILYCDSATLYSARNVLEAFSQVRIVQPGGTQVDGDYLRYTGNIKMAYLKGNAHLTDGKNNLWCESLNYDVGTKTAIYDEGGTLQSETTNVTSKSGIYYVSNKDARFTGNVVVTDPQYTVYSDDMGYNTETKVVTFFGPSVIRNDASELRTSRGTWDSKAEIAHLTSRSALWNESQYLESDTLDYYRFTGEGLAKGNVYALDTVQQLTLYSGYAEFNEVTQRLKSYIKPVLKKMNGADSLFMRADTFYSARVRQLRFEPEEKPRKGKTALPPKPLRARVIKDADTSSKRYFTGWAHVKVFSDSMQARCDSLSYSQEDSTLRLMKSPVAWSRKSQITGDTIYLYNENGQLKRAYIPNNALIVSLSGPVRSQLYDQIQGKMLTAYFDSSGITEMYVRPDVQTIYYAKDDGGAYIGMSQASSNYMRVYFGNAQIRKIFFGEDVKQVTTPLQQVDIPNARLSRFTWLEDIRPKTLSELFR